MIRECGGCTFCCFSFGVKAVEKSCLTKCQHECEKGCAIYDAKPKACTKFQCPYILFEGFHRPDTFNELRTMACNVGDWIPAIPIQVPAEKALALIKSTHSVMAAILSDQMMWACVVLPLERDEKGSWQSEPGAVHKWATLCRKSGAPFGPEGFDPWADTMKENQRG